jgi:beta-glucosidase
MFIKVDAARTNEIQRIAVEESRLGIPVLFGQDVIHGQHTMFPLPLAQAASFDPSAAERVAEISAVEATADGVRWTFSPMVDIARDPRWGRIAEGYGEDTFLCCRMAEATVRGYQGDDLSDPTKLCACAKHFAAYGAAEAGRDYNTVDMSERTLREVYLPSFKATVDAGVGTFMTAFNEISGIPCTGSRFLLTDVLRGEWGFDGFVVSDCFAVREQIQHGFAADGREAAKKAIIAGCDMEMQTPLYAENLAQLIADGEIDESVVDEAVRRVLTIKARLGLFENPYTDISRKSVILSREHLDAAREVARRCAVLLKNDGNLLPLKKDLKSVAVIGPYVTEETKYEWRGCWTIIGGPESFTPFVDAVRGVVSSDTNVLVNDGSDPDFRGAVEAARASEVAIVVVGEDADRSGEAHSVADIGLQGNQEALVRAIVATGTPTVVVLINGRPLAISWLAENVPAILEAWHSGSGGALAAADVLFGDANPGGKLPASFPRVTGQVPIHYNHKSTGRPALDLNETWISRHMDILPTPLFPFGHGLSYTTFGYSDLSISPASPKVGDSIKVSATVSNTGDRAGDEVVQLYIRDVSASVTRPVKELKGFERITLQPGESRRVEFTLTPESLSFIGVDLKPTVEPGLFRVWVGTSSAEGLESSFVLS